jgi:hypothetical protein
MFCNIPEETPPMTFYAITATAIEHYTDALVQFEHLLGMLTQEESQRVTHGELEAMVQAEGSELLRLLIQGHVDQRSVEEPVGERVVGADGIARAHRRAGCTRRLETGARWRLERAEAILKLRSLKISGDLPDSLAFHFEQEHKRNDPGPPIPLAESHAASTRTHGQCTWHRKYRP